MKDYKNFYNEIKQHNFKNPSDKSGLSSDERTVFDFRYNYDFFKNLPLNPEERINKSFSGKKIGKEFKTDIELNRLIMEKTNEIIELKKQIEQLNKLKIENKG